jgi:hypothetical protein
VCWRGLRRGGWKRMIFGFIVILGEEGGEMLTRIYAVVKCSDHTYQDDGLEVMDRMFAW